MSFPFIASVFMIHLPSNIDIIARHPSTALHSNWSLHLFALRVFNICTMHVYYSQNVYTKYFRFFVYKIFTFSLFSRDFSWFTHFLMLSIVIVSLMLIFLFYFYLSCTNVV